MTSMMAVLDVPPQSEEVRWCNLCQDKGIPSKLRPFQINLTEAVFMCPNTNCTYPMGTNHQADIIRRDATKLKTSGKRKSSEDHLGRRKHRKLSRRISVSAPGSVCPSPSRSACFSPPPVLTDESSMDSVFEYTALNETKKAIVPSPGLPTQQLKPSVQSEIIFPNGNAVVSETDVSKSVPATELSKYLHWWNKDALCWLDVALCILVHSPTVRKLLKDIDSEQNMLRSVVKAFDQAQLLLNGVNAGKSVHLETSVGRVTVKTGGGDSPIHPSKRPKVFQHQKSLYNSNPESPVQAEISIEPSDQRTKASHVLDTVREDVWHRLQPKMKCPRGTNDSPVFAVPLILRESAPLMQTFMVNYRWEMSCTECGYHHTDSVARCMPTFPNVTPDFKMTDGAFLRDCFMCPASNQRMTMKFNKMPPVLMVHFVEGLPHNNYASYDFVYDRRQFVVSAIIQFKNNPDHFVAWIRNTSDATWMEVDDLRRSTASFGPVPTFPPSQVHIMMWEERVVPVRPASLSPVSWVQHSGNTVTTVSVAGNGCRSTPAPVVSTPAPMPAPMSSVSTNRSVPSAGKLPNQPAPAVISAPKPVYKPLGVTQGKVSKKPLPKNARSVPPIRGGSLVAPCTDSNLSRMERLRQNAARLKALKADSASKSKPLAPNSMSSVPGGMKALKVPTPKNTSNTTYLGALQPYLYTSEVKGSTAAIPGISKVPKFQAFSFSKHPDPIKKPASVNTTDSKIVEKGSVVPVSNKGKGPPQVKAPEPTKPEPSVQKPRQSRNSLKAGVPEDIGNTCAPSGKGKGKGKGKKSTGKSKFVMAKEQQGENSTGQVFIRGDPAASKYVSATSPAPVNVTNPQPMEVNKPAEIVEDEACSILEAATIIASITSPELKDSPQKAEPVVKQASSILADSLIEAPAVNQKDPILDLFDEMNFGANIDFTDLNFNMDDFLV